MKNLNFRVDTINELHAIAGFEKPKHPLVSIIDYSKVDILSGPNSGSFICGFYSINFKKHCSFLYGRQKFDHNEGTLHCTSPEQIITYDKTKETESPEGWGLYFHPELIRNTALGAKICEYTFFNYDKNEALHLSEQEEKTLVFLLRQMEIECDTNIDKYSQELIVSNIELLLNYCKRFYSRQFITRTNQNKDIVSNFERLLLDYLHSETIHDKGIPKVKYLADLMNLSPNYFSDLLKSETGKNTQEHIHYFMLEKAKNLLRNSELSISEIAYELGFEYSQSFSKFFKKKSGISPKIYRAG